MEGAIQENSGNHRGFIRSRRRERDTKIFEEELKRQGCYVWEAILAKVMRSTQPKRTLNA